MSIESIKSAIASSVESPNDLLVLVLLADHLNGKTGLCCPSIPLLAEECRRDERSIFRALKRLEDQGHISRDSGRGVGHSNRYRIHPQGRRKRRAKHEPDSSSDEDQNLTPASPFDDGEKVTKSTSKPDASVTQKVTELAPKPDASVTLTGSNQNLTGKEPEDAPIESASASSHFALNETVEPKLKAKSANRGKGSLDEIMAFCKEIDLFPRDAEYLFHKWEGCGWKNGNASIKDWKATIRAWKAQGYLPSQKSPSPSDFWPSASVELEEEEHEDLLAKLLRNKAKREQEELEAQGQPPEVVDWDPYWDGEPDSTPQPKDEDEPFTDEEIFEHFEKTMWELYPPARKSTKHRTDFARMLREIPAESRSQAWRALKAWNNSSNWKQEDGKYIPGIIKFFEDKRWTHPPKTGSSNTCPVDGY
jgi:DNA-binding MarR family transcriptional regulator